MPERMTCQQEVCRRQNRTISACRSCCKYKGFVHTDTGLHQCVMGDQRWEASPVPTPADITPKVVRVIPLSPP